MVLGLLVAAGLALTPAAFARGHIDIGINVPGVSVGYYGGHRGHGYVGVGGYYGGYYAPAPVYYDDYYYSPYYDAPYPAYGVVYSHPHRYYNHYNRYQYRNRGYDRRGYR